MKEWSNIYEQTRNMRGGLSIGRDLDKGNPRNLNNK